MTVPSWTVYMVCCADDSLYTGITTDPDRRIKEHNSSVKGARYTRSRRPVHLVYAEVCESRSEALKREKALKALSRKEKHQLIKKY